MSEKLEALAGKLTEAQRQAIIDLRGSLAVCRALKRKGLSYGTEGTGMAWMAYPRLNEDGYAIRRHLQHAGNQPSTGKVATKDNGNG